MLPNMTILPATICYLEQTITDCNAFPTVPNLTAAYDILYLLVLIISWIIAIKKS